MASNLALDDDLIKEAQRIGGVKTKKGVITEALIEYIQRRKQIEIISQFGTVDYDGDYDYKKYRNINENSCWYFCLVNIELKLYNAFLWMSGIFLKFHLVSGDTFRK